MESVRTYQENDYFFILPQLETGRGRNYTLFNRMRNKKLSSADNIKSKDVLFALLSKSGFLKKA